MPCCIINPVLGWINPGCTFLDDISFDGLRASFKNLKLASYSIERTPKRPTIIPLLLSFLSKFGVFGCQEKSHFLPIFQVVFQQFFLSKNGLILHSFIFQFQIYWCLGETHFLLVWIQKEVESSLVWTPSVLRKKKV